MNEIVIDIPDEMSRDMSMFRGINWEFIIRKILKEELSRMAELRRLMSNSEMTEEDAKKLAEEVDKRLSKRFMKSGE